MMDLVLGTIDLTNFLFFEVGLSKFFDWFKEQAKYVLFIVLLALLIVTMVRRAWIQFIGVLVGLGLVGIFILQPESLLKLSSWLAGKLSIN